MALLRQAHPDATVAQLEAGGESAPWTSVAPGPDNDSGYGLLNAPAALAWLAKCTAA